jgi:predicted nucleotidyltransferase
MTIAARADELDEVRAILRTHLPDGVRAGVFGSRVDGTPKPWSDLDLVLDAGEPLPLAVMAALGEAFDESALAWKVDLVDRHAVSEAFRQIIDAGQEPLDF